MANTSNKHRNKKITRFILIALVVLLVGSFIISRSDKKVDMDVINSVETVEDGPHLKGNTEAELALIEFADFQCPACAQTYPVVTQLTDAYGDQFSLEFKHFPLRTIHPNAQLAAQASEAAAMQGTFWEMHNMLFENQSEWAQSINPKKFFSQYAEAIGINVERFEYDLTSDEVKERVNEDANEAELLMLPGTPSFMLNGEQITLQEFVAMLDIEVPEETTTPAE